MKTEVENSRGKLVDLKTYVYIGRSIPSINSAFAEFTRQLRDSNSRDIRFVPSKIFKFQNFVCFLSKSRKMPGKWSGGPKFKKPKKRSSMHDLYDKAFLKNKKKKLSKIAYWQFLTLSDKFEFFLIIFFSKFLNGFSGRGYVPGVQENGQATERNASSTRRLNFFNFQKIRKVGKSG